MKKKLFGAIDRSNEGSNSDLILWMEQILTAQGSNYYAAT